MTFGRTCRWFVIFADNPKTQRLGAYKVLLLPDAWIFKASQAFVSVMFLTLGLPVRPVDAFFRISLKEDNSVYASEMGRGRGYESLYFSCTPPPGLIVQCSSVRWLNPCLPWTQKVK